MTGDTPQAQGRDRSFRRIATFAGYHNTDPSDETVSEIIAATADGKLLVYTDSPGERIGFIDIKDPAHPAPAGTLPVGGEPTSVDVIGNKYAVVGVNTSSDFVNPSGNLVVVELNAAAIVATIPLGGQPDSVKVSPDQQYIAVVIENERDEDVDDGELPQFPAGGLKIIRTSGQPASWTPVHVSLANLSNYAPGDPEPEFVDVNDKNQAVVTLQENNHVVIVDLASATVVADFPAGTVDLARIDASESGSIIELDDSLNDVPREPDGVTWIGRNKVATANEGDLFGGSRGFTIFDTEGGVLFDSGNTLEHLAVRYGHYPEDRSANKGTEPESIEYATFGQDNYLFVGSERGSFVAVYSVNSDPVFKHILPAPLGPEGLLAIPSRNLLVVSGEEDDPEFGVRSTVMIYELAVGPPTYPHIYSSDYASGPFAGTPIAWSALSGLTATSNPNTQLAVWDSYYTQSRIFTIDTSVAPAVITNALTINGAANLDPEGITILDGYYWIASEGNASGSRPNRLLKIDPSNGDVLAQVGLPAEIENCRVLSNQYFAANMISSTLGSGFEGVAAVNGKLYVAQQRGWHYIDADQDEDAAGCTDLDDVEPGDGLDFGDEPPRTRIWIYDPSDGTWEHAVWELEGVPDNADWVGVSEITYVTGNSFVLIERDNLTGDFAKLKTLVRVPGSALEPEATVTPALKTVFDLLPALTATNGWITDKPEGVAITSTGATFLVTDNDGVEDWSGETWFLDLGDVTTLFD
jgi:hypothetical protein